MIELSMVLTALVGTVLAATAVDDKPADAVTAKMVHYTGRVQGVGFRAATADIAKKFPVTGWVKNLDDGRVQLLVEGKEADVKKFLDAVRDYWKKNVEKVQTEDRKPLGTFKGFTVAY